MEPQLLSIDARPLTPHRDGGSKRSFDLLSCFQSLGYHIDAAALFERSFPPYDHYLADSRRLLTEAGFSMIEDTLEAHLRAHGHQYDAIVIAGPAVGRAVIQKLRAQCPRAVIFYDTIDLAHRRLFQEAKASRSTAILRRALLAKANETLSITHSDAVFAVSSEERTLINEISPQVPCCIFPGVFSPISGERLFEKTDELVFLGSFTHSPNIDAVQFWNSQIGPELKKSDFLRPLTVAGDSSELLTDAVHQSNFIRSIGYTASLEDLFSTARLFVAPLRFGAGIKTKILEALRRGVPCITTPVGAEGIAETSSPMLEIVSSAEEFAATVITRYYDAHRWYQGVEESRHAVATSFGLEVQVARLKAFLGTISLLRPFRTSAG